VQYSRRFESAALSAAHTAAAPATRVAMIPATGQNAVESQMC